MKYLCTAFSIKIKKFDSISKGGFFQGPSFLRSIIFPRYIPVSCIPAVLFHVSCSAKDDWLLAIVVQRVISNRREKRRRCNRARTCVRALPPTSGAGILRSLFLSTHSRFLIAQKYSPFAGQRCAVYAASCFYRSFTRGISTILREILVPTSSYVARMYDYIDASD